MRMWMVPPKLMCRQHLLGEHLELHMFATTIKQGKKIKGFINNNLCEPLSLEKRHEELVQEMIKRKYNHKSPFPKLKEEDLSYLYEDIDKTIDSQKSEKDLMERCPRCWARNVIYNNYLDKEEK
jgi:hypothetical protein